MKNTIKIIAFCMSFLPLFGTVYAQDNPPKSAQFNSVKLSALDAQPFTSSTLYSDSTGNGYINLTLKALPNGLFEAAEGSGLDGSTLIAFKNLTPEEVDYIVKFIEYRAAKKKIVN